MPELDGFHSIRFVTGFYGAFYLGRHYNEIMDWALAENHKVHIANRESFWWDNRICMGPAIMTTDEDTQFLIRMRFI